MIETTGNMLTFAEKRDEQVSKVLEKVYSAAQAGAVYSQPVTAGDYTIITASEVVAGGGFSSGIGIGATKSSPMPQEEVPQAQPARGGGVGSGVGGGGGSSGRPVAVIIIGPKGVTVKPVVDVTKLVLAGVTAWGA